NNLRLQATNAAGTTTTPRTITLDTLGPAGSLVQPAAETSVGTDPGFVEIQWADAGAAGLDTSTFDTADITIPVVDVDRIQDLGSGRVRYIYNDDGDTLPSGTVNVTLVAGQVTDLVGNGNAVRTQ